MYSHIDKKFLTFAAYINMQIVQWIVNRKLASLDWVRTDMDDGWTSRPASLEIHHEPKDVLQTMEQTILQQIHTQKNPNWTKGAVGHFCFYFMRLFPSMFKGLLHRPRYRGSEILLNIGTPEKYYQVPLP